MFIFFINVLIAGTRTQDYLSAVAKREIAWISAFARPRPEDDLFRRSDSQEDPAVHVDLLERYLKVVPFVLPKEDAFHVPSMLHMDLHMGNIFIRSADKPKITAIIDWQGTDIRPLYLAARFPRIVDYDIGEDPITLDMPPTLEDGDMDDDEKRMATEERDAAMLKKY